MSKYTVGRDYEVKVCEYLEKKGWSVWRPTKSRFYSKYSSQDVFGVFDILAANRRLIRFIQVKKDEGFRENVEKEIVDSPIPEGFGALFCIREYWIIKKNGETKIRRYIFQKDKMVRVEAPVEALDFSKFLKMR